MVETKVIKGIPRTGMNEAVEEAIRETKFYPALHDGEPYGALEKFEFHFKL